MESDAAAELRGPRRDGAAGRAGIEIRTALGSSVSTRYLAKCNRRTPEGRQLISADDECLSLRPIPLSVRDPCPRDRESNPSPSTAGSANPLSAALRCLSLPCNGSVQLLAEKCRFGLASRMRSEQ